MNSARLIARLIRELLKQQSYESYVDLIEDVKGCCARYRIRYDPQDITDALRLIESNRQIGGRA